MDISPPQVTSETRNPAKELTRVLVIDDDDSVSAAIQAILAGRRCETVITSRAYAGIRALQQSSFDVVMLDIFMPGLNGLDTIEHIRRNSSIPIIAMSGFQLRGSADHVDYLGLAAQRGASLCIRKPFQPAQLIQTIEWSQRLPRPAQGSVS
jgi:CheY-like chemotaxis protein